MPTSREAELKAEIRRLRAQARRDFEALSDAEENTRVYRRLAHRQIVRGDRLEAVLASLRDQASDALASD